MDGVQVIISVDNKEVLYLYDKDIKDLLVSNVSATNNIDASRISVQINTPPKKHDQ